MLFCSGTALSYTVATPARKNRMENRKKKDTKEGNSQNETKKENREKTE
jgi:hypothetical protein